MKLRTWLRYLIGDRQAILEIAGDRKALVVGAVFVLSAGIAREYDQEDLLHEPWYVLIPFAVTLVASLLFFALPFGILKAKTAEPAPSFLAGYPTFLGLFWMTAPLAWLYAIPYERFLSPLIATQANLWTLGLVALWRVVLMVRVVSVLMNYSLFASAGLVMFLADLEALVALQFLPWPLIDVMGGLMMSENESLKRAAVCIVVQAGVVSFPLWVIGAAFALTAKNLAWRGPFIQYRSALRARGMLPLAVTSVLVWAFLLPFSQPPVMRKRIVERLFEEGQVAAALAELSRHEPADYPPTWEPPPNHAHLKPGIFLVIDVLADQPAAPWINDIYLNKIARVRSSWRYNFDRSDTMGLARSLVRIPGGREKLEEWADGEDQGYIKWKDILKQVDGEERRDDLAAPADRRARDELPNP